MSIPAQARKRPSPAPMRTPSSTNTHPAIGRRTPHTAMPTATAVRTSGSDVKRSANHQPPAAMTTPSPAPAATPHWRVRRRTARTRGTSSAPSPCPTSACAAMASASSANAASPQTEFTTW
ncbi:Uncharacterised protein [Mycobacteroides abscessus]|nr:Uncharacterised protein [Mycobacteroides abscessus]